MQARSVAVPAKERKKNTFMALTAKTFTMFEPFYLMYLFQCKLLMMGFQCVKCRGVPKGEWHGAGFSFACIAGSFRCGSVLFFTLEGCIDLCLCVGWVRVGGGALFLH